ncbi:MAG: iron-containing alcohol dehydrogenase [Muribaculaceae bacterium]|nr:iron-containing alcohol dehydrogenase [Muribaculaceae bacterium]
MDNFSYCSPTRYLFGHGVESETGRLVEEAGWKTVMIVYGGGSAVRSGLLGRVCDSLSHHGITFVTFGGIQPNPVDGPVRDGIDICRRAGVQALLAVGGGSVIDTAKAIAAGVLYDGDFWDFYSGKTPVERALPVGVVLTIPAAGSEGSGNSVITNATTGQKISIRTDFALRPKFAIMDPELTMTLPREQTAAGVADMMAHILERYFTTTADVEVTDRLAEGLLIAIMNSARRIEAHPHDYEARANLMWSGTLAHNGLCGCGRKEDWASHGLEHVLSALYNVTHGAGLAVVFPAWMTYMADKSPSKVAQLGRRVFVVTDTDDKAAALAAVAALRAFFKELGLPLTLKELGIENPDYKLYADDFHRDKGNPYRGYYTLTPSDTEAIYRLMQ